MFEFKLPDLGEGIHEGELLKWYVKERDAIRENDPLCDMETDKAAVTIPSPRTGTIHQLGARPGDTVAVGAVLVVIDDSSREITPDDTGQSVIRSHQQDSTPDLDHEKIAVIPGRRVAASPAVRRTAREMGIDIAMVMGTGPGGRITREDLKQYQATGKSDEQPASSPPNGESEVPKKDTAPSETKIPFLETASLPDFSRQGPVEIVPIRSLRKKVAVKTTSSAILVPHVAHMDEIDVTKLEKLRRQYNQNGNPIGHLTTMTFVIKAIASLLKKYPSFNASLDSERMEIILKKYYHIGFAADTPRGLMVPVIRNVDGLSLDSLGFRIRYLAGKALENKVTADELTGGTFSVTNVGTIGGTGVLPIINTPETAILGMGRVAKKPVVIGDAVAIRQILPVTLGFDHRVADGAQAARFVRDLKTVLEDPVKFLIRM